VTLDIVVLFWMDPALLREPTLFFHYRRHGASASSTTLLDGTRFQGERAYFALAAAQLAVLGWRRAPHGCTSAPASTRSPCCLALCAKTRVAPAFWSGTPLLAGGVADSRVAAPQLLGRQTCN
jgi:hypothetical protein